MGSTPGSGAGKPETPEQITKLGQIAETILKQAGPLRKELLGQTLEALKTGGVGARIPVIQRAVESSKQATSNALRGTTESLGATGLASSPYGQSILANIRTQGGQATSQIPTQIAENFIGAAPGIVASMQGQGLQGLQASGSIELQNRQFAADQFVKLMEDIKSSLQSLGTYGSSSGSPNYQSGGGGGGVSNTGYI